MVLIPSQVASTYRTVRATADALNTIYIDIVQHVFFSVILLYIFQSINIFPSVSMIASLSSRLPFSGWAIYIYIYDFPITSSISQTLQRSHTVFCVEGINIYFEQHYIIGKSQYSEVVNIHDDNCVRVRISQVWCSAHSIA